MIGSGGMKENTIKDDIKVSNMKRTDIVISRRRVVLEKSRWRCLVVHSGGRSGLEIVTY